MEIVPADSTLLDDNAYVDYSFVTGESKPIKVSKAELVYAGGRLIGTSVKLAIEKRISQSHLTTLWNNDAFKKITESKYQKTIDTAARKFTWIVMGIAILTAAFWQLTNPSQMWLVLTSVLMVACPCALALAAPFTYGSMLRVFGRNKLYLKNADVIERMASINAVVFDKTGTITHGGEPEITFTGILEEKELHAIQSLTQSSSHPLSTIISKSIRSTGAEKVLHFKEQSGKGIEGIVNGAFYQVGSALFVNAASKDDSTNSHVYVAVDGIVRGYFSIRISVRQNIRTMIRRLGKKCVALLSGDNDGDLAKMKSLFGPRPRLLFNQNPHDKLNFIKSLQFEGRKVLMVGDGLNDSGALKQSDVGIAVTDDAAVFTPACDGILAGENLNSLDKYLDLARASSTILKIGFGISFFYNAIGLTFAVTGHLTPLAAAILMPMSSISVVGFSSTAVSFMAKRRLQNNK
jgi:Cu+-exporting ATPase